MRKPAMEPSVADSVMKKFNVSAPTPKISPDMPATRTPVMPAPRRSMSPAMIAHQFKKRA